jgi:carbonic anhydrase/acetyltransferase-like protein (isoleucine patch superfamily)
MTLYRVNGLGPTVHDTAFIAPEATVIGQATIGARASVWPGAVVRADNEPITVGDDSNVQEGAVLHVDAGKPLVIGRGVTIGHQAMLHGCINRC